MNQLKVKTGSFTGAAAAVTLDLGFVPDFFEWWMNEALADTNKASGKWNSDMADGDAWILSCISAAGAVITPSFETTNGITKLDTTKMYPTPWEASTVYALGDIIHPRINNGYFYKCTVAGTSKALPEPAWGTTPGGTTADNTVTWTCYKQADLEVEKGKKQGVIVGTGCMTDAKSYKYLAIRSSQ